MNTSTDEDLVANSVVSLVESWLSCRLSALTLMPLCFSNSGIAALSSSP